MQRIAVLLLCAGMWTAQASAQSCEQVGAVVGGFAGGATGYGLVTSLGVASNWVAAGLYGAGITVASMAGRAAAVSGCDNLAAGIRWYGEMSCRYSGFNYDCGDVQTVARSLYADFVMCPSCTFDEVFGAFLLEDSARGNFLRDMQYRRTGNWSLLTTVVPRNHVGTFSNSVLNSYFVGVQAGFRLMRTTSMYVNRR